MPPITQGIWFRKSYCRNLLNVCHDIPCALGCHATPSLRSLMHSPLVAGATFPCARSSCLTRRTHDSLTSENNATPMVTLPQRSAARFARRALKSPRSTSSKRDSHLTSHGGQQRKLRVPESQGDSPPRAKLPCAHPRVRGEPWLLLKADVLTRIYTSSRPRRDA